MKAVQIGILAALVVCAGLLYTVYHGQRSVPEPIAATQTPAEAQAPAPVPVEPAAVEQAAPAAAAQPAEPIEKPSPAPRRKETTRRPATQVAAARPQQQIPASAPAAADPAAQAPAAQPQPPAVPVPAAEPVAPEPRPEPQHVTIPAGTMISVRLAESISSDRRQPGEAFSATLDQPLIVDGFAIAERGAKVQGKIVEAQQAGRVRGLSAITLELTKLYTSDGQQVAINTARFTKQGEKSVGEDAKKVGVGAAIGAAIGAIAGGGKGAAIGAGVGGAAGAGTVAATRGKPVELPVETRLTFRLEQPVTLTERVP